MILLNHSPSYLGSVVKQWGGGDTFNAEPYTFYGAVTISDGVTEGYFDIVNPLAFNVSPVNGLRFVLVGNLWVGHTIVAGPVGSGSLELTVVNPPNPPPGFLTNELIIHRATFAAGVTQNGIVALNNYDDIAFQQFNGYVNAAAIVQMIIGFNGLKLTF